MINANIVKELRERTGVGMMDCKKALSETGGSLEDAVEWLRKKGLATAAKKTDRVASEGLIALEIHGNYGAIIELNSETDFVAKNTRFQDLARSLVKDFINFKGDLNAFKESVSSKTNKKISDEIASHIAVIGENINLNRAKRLHVENGSVAGYVHNSIAPGLGKVGVLISFETDIDHAKISELGKQIAMHIAAMRPDYLSIENVNPVLIKKEREVHRDVAKSSGKPDNIIDKMVEGKIVKFFEQIVLLEQTFVVDGNTKISELLKEFGSKNNGNVKIKEFVHLKLGENSL
jgi:elongation factor Ts